MEAAGPSGKGLGFSFLLPFSENQKNDSLMWEGGTRCVTVESQLSPSGPISLL